MSKEKTSKYTWEYPKDKEVSKSPIAEEWETLKKLAEKEEKWKAIYEPTRYGAGYATTATESRDGRLYSSRDGKLQVGTSDGSTITININKNSIEFDGIEITTEMLRNVTKKIKEETEGPDW